MSICTKFQVNRIISATIIALHTDRNLKNFPHGCNVLIYFCVSLYTRYLGIVHQKIHQFCRTYKHLCQISNESDNFCDHYASHTDRLEYKRQNLLEFNVEVLLMFRQFQKKSIPKRAALINVILEFEFIIHLITK